MVMENQTAALSPMFASFCAKTVCPGGIGTWKVKSATFFGFDQQEQVLRE